ncbi:hypothetical protein H7Y40_01540 [Pedobacter sp.]|nr:hypothetical protein [Candidatus Saccharibacteria bacterium]
MQNELNGLFQKKMDRLTFLKHVGVGVVALTGVSAIVKTMGGLGSTPSQATGYGASAYGGKSLSR